MGPPSRLWLLQVSEDHCWVSLDGSGRREASAEVTTATAAKRATEVDEQVRIRSTVRDTYHLITLYYTIPL